MSPVVWCPQQPSSLWWCVRSCVPHNSRVQLVPVWCHWYSDSHRTNCRMCDFNHAYSIRNTRWKVTLSSQHGAWMLGCAMRRSSPARIGALCATETEVDDGQVGAAATRSG
eukprot:8678135-Pyramimonas_sp.AAC.1